MVMYRWPRAEFQDCTFIMLVLRFSSNDCSVEKVGVSVNTKMWNTLHCPLLNSDLFLLIVACV